MTGVSLDILKAINDGLLDHRWTNADLEQLSTADSGVVSCVDALFSELSRILEKDLGDTGLHREGLVGRI